MESSVHWEGPQLEGWQGEHGKGPAEPANGRRGNKLGLGILGLLGLVFGGFPYWAARRVMYPVNPAMPRTIPDHLEVDLPDGAAPEYVEFAARDGGKLGGWFVPGPHSAPAPWPCIMLAYGYGGFKEQMAYYAKIVQEAGFASFMFDMEGTGLRRGRPVTMGYKEKWDLMDAVSYVCSRPDVDAERLGAFGVSMGAATALLAAEDEPRIKAIVADSSYATVVDMIKPGLRTFIGAPATAFAPLIVLFAESMMGVKARDITPVQSARKLGDRPILIIHGADDALTDPHSADEIYDAVEGPKELWIIPDCAHARGPEVVYDEYRRRVNKFFTESLAVPAREAAEVV